uniref:Ig-like domain-containing protein n=1 Tax=Gadus morhua TaxID=8049 RepID=A0A8C4ZIZ2_GADMO
MSSFSLSRSRSLPLPPSLFPERPRVSLLQRSPSSPVVCHATGFYPDRVVVFWRRDGQELHEQVDPGEVLPNHDGTFQVSVDLNLKAVPQEDWGRYECVVQLKGIEDISTPLDPALIRTNGGKTVFVFQKRNGERIKLSRRTNTCLHLPLLPVPFLRSDWLSSHTGGLVVETSPPLNDEPPPMSTEMLWH